MNKKNLTVDQIVQIYFLRKGSNTEEPLNQQQIADKLGLAYSQVWSALRAINKTWNTKKNTHNSKDRYVHAVIKIKGLLMQEGRKAKLSVKPEHVEVEQTINVKTPTKENSVDKLAKAFELFESAISDFVETEVDAQSKAIKLENIELKLQAELLKVENTKLKTEGQKSNVFGKLRTRFANGQSA